MTTARRTQIYLDETKYYHCISRCVRRAFLCGEDSLTSHNFSHRREWIYTRMKQLASIFSIDISAYAIMSNHYHLVLHVNRDQALDWDDKTVISQWTKICKPKPVIARYLTGNTISDSDLLVVKLCVAEYRERLMSISWFMRYLNEYIARLANQEDNCTGRFWEGRFKCQALLDETAILACMAYVDLNPIRASMADSLEASDFTSIQERMGIQPNDLTVANDDPTKEEKENTLNLIQDKLANAPIAPLQNFAGNTHQHNDKQAIPHELINYLALVDWTSQQIHPNKRGVVNTAQPSILTKLNITEANWLEFCSRIEKDFNRAIGSSEQLLRYGVAANKKRQCGMTNAKRYYATPAALS